jgi:hypothetical protein
MPMKGTVALVAGSMAKALPTTPPEYSSRILGARMSRERVMRKVTSRTGFHTAPTFHAKTVPLVL